MTSDPTSWSALKTSLANWLNRADFNTAEIPEAIALAERRFQRTLFTPDREAEATLTASAEAVSLPADFWGAKAAYVDGDPKSVLEQMTLAELRNAFPAAATGKPRNYAIRGLSMILGPAPDSICSIKLTYLQTIPALGASQADNWLLTAHPDAYLHGALFELFSLTMDETRAAYHEGKLNLIIDESTGPGAAAPTARPRSASALP